MPEAVKLTATAKAAGCAAKLSPSLLEAVLRRLPLPNDPNVLVGFETSDDAGVYRVADDLALVQTIDFFTPIVDDPFLFGQIAAANALSDVYAMGGRPVSALSIVAFPPNGAPDLLEQIMRGGLSKISEAGATVVGGHSIRDDELKFGYAVTGLIRSTQNLAQCRREARRCTDSHEASRHGRDFDCAEAVPRDGRFHSRGERLDVPPEQKRRGCVA